MEARALSRRSLDPIWTGKFFQPPKSEEKAAPLKFSMPVAKTDVEFAKNIKAFLASKEGQLFKDGVEDIITQIKAVINDWSISAGKKKQWCKGLDSFFDKRFSTYIGSNEEYNKTLWLLYSRGVIALHNIVQKIKDPEIPIALRQKVMHNLLDGDELERCGPGTAGFIQDSYMHLVMNAASMLMTARREIALQVATDKHLTLDVNKEEHELGMELHYARFMAYRNGEALSIQEPWDCYFSHLEESKVEELSSEWVAQIPSALTLENVLVQILAGFDLTAIVTELQDKFEELKKETSDPTPVFVAYYESRLSQLKKQLDQYGLDEDWVINHFFDCEYEDLGQEKSLKIRLQPGAQKTLESTLIDRLFLQGYLQKDQRIRVYLQSGDQLCLLLGSHNFNLSYIKKEKAYCAFSTFNETLKPQQKQEIFDKLIVIIKRLKPSPRRDLIIQLGNLIDQQGDFYLQCLKEKIINATTKDKNDLIPMLIAASKGFVSVIQLLASEAKEMLDATDKNGLKLIHLAAQNGKVEVMRFLTKQYQVAVDELDGKGRTALWYAAHSKQLRAVKWLIKKGAQLSPEIKTCLMAFVETDSALFLRWLKKKIIDPATFNAGGMSAVHMAAKKGYMNIITYLANEAKDMLCHTDITDSIPLHFAAEGGQLEVVKYLVEDCHVPLDCQNRDGLTPLYYAVVGQHIDVAHWLIKKGASLNGKCSSGETFLEIALFAKNFAMIDLLLISGAKLPTHVYKKQTFLDNALQQEKLAAFQEIPRSSISEEEKSSRTFWLRNFRQRTLAVYQQQTAEAQSKRVTLKKELSEFTRLDREILQFRKVIRKKLDICKRKAKPLFREKIAPFNAIFDKAYEMFHAGNAVNNVLSYVIKNCREVLTSSFVLSESISPSQLFEQPKTFRVQCEEVLLEMERHTKEAYMSTVNESPTFT